MILTLTIIHLGLYVFFLSAERAPNILTAGSELNDRKWHFVRFSRQGLFLSLVVDGHEVKGDILFSFKESIFREKLTFLHKK